MRLRETRQCRWVIGFRHTLQRNGLRRRQCLTHLLQLGARFLHGAGLRIAGPARERRPALRRRTTLYCYCARG